MMIYNIMLVLCVLPGFFLPRDKRAVQAVYCLAAWAVLFCVSAFRYEVTYDYAEYANFFNKLLVENDYGVLSADMSEKGFLFFTRLLTHISFDYQILFIVSALLTVSAIMLYIYRYSALPFVSVGFFLTTGMFFNSMQFIRQYIAAIIIMLALRLIMKKQLLAYIILILLASAFHISALLVLPLYFLQRIRLNTAWLVGTLTAGGIAYAFSFQLLELITSRVYTTYKIATDYEILNGISPAYAIPYLVIFIFAFALRKKLVEADSFNSLLINCLYLAVLFMLFGTKHAVLSRFAVILYLAPVLILTPQIVLIIKQRLTRGWRTAGAFALCLAAIVFFAGLYQNLLLTNYNHVVPYQWVFSANGEAS